MRPEGPCAVFQPDCLKSQIPSTKLFTLLNKLYSNSNNIGRVHTEDLHSRSSQDDLTGQVNHKFKIPNRFKAIVCFSEFTI